MLVLSRKQKQRISIDNGRITVVVCSIQGGNVRIGIEAPPEVSVHREEIQLERELRIAAEEEAQAASA